MKAYIYGLVIMVALSLSSCEKETEGVSKITYYVNFELVGGETFLVKLGDSFTDPGVIATEGDQDVSAGVKASGSVNSNQLGIYTIQYSAVNVDGFTASASRKVVVYNPNITTNISGAYTVSAGTHRLALASAAEVPYSGYPVTISKVAPGIFYVNDLFGGYYEIRANYGASYAMNGYISLNEDNSIDLISSHINGWGDSLDELADATYDPATGVIQWGAVYVGAYSFNVILTK